MNVFLFMIMFAGGCKNDLSLTDHHQKENFFCGQNCDLNRYKIFSGKAIHLEVEPAMDIGQVFYNLDPTSLAQMPLVISPLLKIEGFALGAEPYWEYESHAHLKDKFKSFFDIVAIPINQAPPSAPRAQIIKSHLNKDSSYKITLLKNISYLLVLNPGGYLGRAPIHLYTGVITKDTSFNFLIDQKHPSLCGRVIAQDGDVFSRYDHPVMQAKIIQGRRLISASTVIHSHGQFCLEVAPLANNNLESPINLEIEPIGNEIALPKISKKIEPKQLLKNMDIGTINLGKLNKPFSVTIDVKGVNGTTVSNGFLYLNAKIGLGETLVKKPLDHDGKAYFDNLYEGHYDIAVVPLSDSPFAMRTIKGIKLDALENNKISLEVPLRSSLHAEVLGPQQKPVKGALIEFSRVGETGLFASEDIFDDMLFKITAGTNDLGQVCHSKFGVETSDSLKCSALLLDEGRYLAHIIPPLGTAHAHKWVTFDFPVQDKISILLEEPQVLLGQILNSSDQTPAKKAFITVYSAEFDPYNQGKIIGNAITDDQGYFTAFISVP